MSFLSDFKDFAMRGNVIDLSIAVVIGTSFGKIVSSLVDGILMPVLGWLTGTSVRSFSVLRNCRHCLLEWLKSRQNKWFDSICCECCN